jgi:hypothetical protein
LNGSPAHAFDHGLLYLAPVSLLLAAIVQLLPAKR